MRLLIRNGTVVDGTGAAPRRADVAIADGVIVGVGTDLADEQAGQTGQTETVELDATGRTVMPGLIDCHMHISFGEARSQEDSDLYTGVESRTLRSAYNLTKVLRAGVTSFSAPGGSYYIGCALRDAVRAGYLRGPRISTAARFISPLLGLGDYYPETVGVPEGSTGVVVNGVDEIRREVRRQVKNGVDFVKLTDSSSGEYTAFRLEEMTAAAEMAHQLRRRIAVHARGSEAVEFAVRSGVDWIMHGDRMTPRVVDLLADSGIPLCPTLTLLANLSEFGEEIGVPRAKRERYHRLLEEHAGPALHLAHQAGVTFMVGTDSGFSITPYGEWHARELELLMKYAGLSSLEAITAGTRNGAVTLGLDGRLGTIEPSMIADVLVVDGDPVADIRVLGDRRRLTVIQAGVVQQFGADDGPGGRRWPYDYNKIIGGGDLFADGFYGLDELEQHHLSEYDAEL